MKDTPLGTGERTLIHNIDNDDFWGCGPDLLGKNMMGKLLEELQLQIRQSQASGEQPLSPAQPQPTGDRTTPVPSETSPPTVPLDRQTEETLPCLAPQTKVIVIGNSNARGVSRELLEV